MTRYLAPARQVAAFFLLCTATGAGHASDLQARNPMAPDVLVLGDSQLAFGAGPVFFEFFSNIAKICGASGRNQAFFKKFGSTKARVMGVRSTGIQHWTTTRWPAKKIICKEDPEWAVNARLYGFPKRSNGQYVQIGKTPGFKYCSTPKPVLEVMMRDPSFRPRLLFLFFMGNAVDRWRSTTAARSDVRRLTENLPADLPCIFMTTSPAYWTRSNTNRAKAQNNLKTAFAAGMNRCGFVAGIDDVTRSAIQANKGYFRKTPSGRVKDGFHINKPGARKFVSLKRNEICSAVARELAAPVTAVRKK
ncbi:MAG TPA: hypothetical protein VMX97_10585 [Hyphomicrobiaceae bacterium]|nr:hypothetical protein [Hyphomicrobiaceae bacterium]